MVAMAEKNGVSAAVGADQNPVDELLGMDKPGDVIDIVIENHIHQKKNELAALNELVKSECSQCQQSA